MKNLKLINYFMIPGSYKSPLEKTFSKQQSVTRYVVNTHFTTTRKRASALHDFCYDPAVYINLLLCRCALNICTKYSVFIYIQSQIWEVLYSDSYQICTMYVIIFQGNCNKKFVSHSMASGSGSRIVSRKYQL